LNEPGAALPIIPESITVHLGAPDQPAQNVTVSFPDYIKNVASNEIYPTWPDASLSANIHAQISFALNRVYTEYYRSRGYDFDITNSTVLDQSYVPGSDIYENVSQIVDRIFTSYIRRRGSVAPLFAAYCDGVNTVCSGLSQWGTVDLAEQGLSDFQILQYYFGNDIELVTNAPVGIVESSLPPAPLSLGSVGNFVRTLQIRLNRVSSNFPAIPKIYPVDGIFGEETEEAVRAFQQVFDLTPDGIVGSATWYRLLYYYNGVKRLNDLYAEGLTYDEVSEQFENTLAPGSTNPGVFTVQYYLAFLAEFINSIPSPPISGFYNETTESSVRAFQDAFGLPVTGEVDLLTWDALHDAYVDAAREFAAASGENIAQPFPGNILSVGANNENVRRLKTYINFLSTVYPEIPTVTESTVFDDELANAVSAFQSLFGLPVVGSVGAVTWNNIADAYNDIALGYRRSVGQYPGYVIGENSAQDQ